MIDEDEDFVGFASMYLERFDEESGEESKSNGEIDKELYAELVELDTRLGTKVSKQLYVCLNHTTRSDIIKVGIFLFMKALKCFRLSILSKLTN